MNGYVSDVHTDCVRHGCVFARGVDVIKAKLMQEFPTRGRRTMEYTQSLWCDFGKHSFSERDPNKKVMAIRGEVDGIEDEEMWTACGDHVPRGPMMALPGTVVPDGDYEGNTGQRL